MEIRTAIANMDLETQFDQTLANADAIFHALNKVNTPTVSAIQSEKKTASQTEKKDTPTESAEVAAVRQTRGRGGRFNPRTSAAAGRGRGRGQGPRPPPTRNPFPHPDGPPEQACTYHWNYGKTAYNCLDITNCPWRTYLTLRR